MRVFVKSIERLSEFAGMVAALLVGIAILIVCQMVFMRYVLVESTAWQTEVVTFSLVGATLLGSAWVLKERGHVAVEIMTSYSTDGIRRGMQIFSDIIVLLFALIMLWKGAEMTWEAWEGAWTTESIYEFPLWIPYLAMPLGFGLLSLQALACVLATLQSEDDIKIERGH